MRLTLHRLDTHCIKKSIFLFGTLRFISIFSCIPPNPLTIIILIVLKYSIDRVSIVHVFSRIFYSDPVVSISCRQYSVDAAIKSQYIEKSIRPSFNIRYATLKTTAKYNL